MKLNLTNKKTWNMIGFIIGIMAVAVGVILATRKAELYQICVVFLSGLLTMLHFGKEAFCSKDADAEDAQIEVFRLAENLYCEGSPILIEAGALMKDHATGSISARLQFKNIQNQNIKAVVVQISPSDILGELLGADVEFHYLDLDAKRNASFGANVPVSLPNIRTRAIRVVVTTVVFSDNSIWAPEFEAWESLREPITLEEGLGESGLVKQYRLEYGKKAKYLFHEEKDLWRCTCGAINRENEPICHACHKQRNELEEIDFEKLEDDFNERLEQEMEDAFERKAKMKIRSKKIVAGVAVAVVVLGVGAFIGKKFYDGKQLNVTYNQAIRQIAMEDYDKAKKNLKKLGNYKDCPDLLEQVSGLENKRDYNLAQQLLQDGQYVEAIDAFKALGEYEDSAQIATQLEQEKVATEQAVTAYQNGDFTNIMTVFTTHQYIFPSENYQSAVQLLQPYIGAWEYASGDAKVLNMREKDDERIKKCKTISVTPQLLDTGQDALMVLVEDFTFNFKINFAEKKLDPVTEFTGGVYQLSLTEEGNLLVTLERQDSEPITCEYKRTQQQ